MDQHHRRGNDAPGDHDPGDPRTGPETLQQDVAGDFEEEIPDEEDAGPDSEGGVAQGQVLEHLQLGKADVHPVQVRENVAQEQKRNQAAVNLGVGPGFEGCIHSVTVVEESASGKEKGGEGEGRVRPAYCGGFGLFVAWASPPVALMRFDGQLR